MRIALLGRTGLLLDAGRLAHEKGHEIALVWTGKSEAHYKINEEDFADFAGDVGAEFSLDTAINSKPVLQRLQESACDIALSVNWRYIIKQPIIDCFKFGILNAHAGDLPRYRGNACPNWAILNGEKRVGLCVHKMTPELDAGPVILRDSFSLEDTTYIEEIEAWLEKRVPAMLVESVEGLVQGKLEGVSQAEGSVRALRTFPRRPEDSRIDWNWSVEKVMRMIRASSRPFEGAFTFLEGEKRVTLWKAQPYLYEGDFLAVPGQVCLVADGDPVIACKDGMIKLDDICVEGVSGCAEAKAIVTGSLRNRLT